MYNDAAQSPGLILRDAGVRPAPRDEVRRCADAQGAGMSETAAYRLVIADDHPLFRGALREAVSGLLADADIAEAGSFDEVSAQLDRAGDIDLVLLDLAMPGV